MADASRELSATPAGPPGAAAQEGPEDFVGQVITANSAVLAVRTAAPVVKRPLSAVHWIGEAEIEKGHVDLNVRQIEAAIADLRSRLDGELKVLVVFYSACWPFWCPLTNHHRTIESQLPDGCLTVGAGSDGIHFAYQRQERLVTRGWCANGRPQLSMLALPAFPVDSRIKILPFSAKSFRGELGNRNPRWLSKAELHAVRMKHRFGDSPSEVQRMMDHVLKGRLEEGDKVQGMLAFGYEFRGDTTVQLLKALEERQGSKIAFAGAWTYFDEVRHMEGFGITGSNGLLFIGDNVRAASLVFEDGLDVVSVKRRLQDFKEHRLDGEVSCAFLFNQDWSGCSQEIFNDVFPHTPLIGGFYLLRHSGSPRTMFGQNILPTEEDRHIGHAKSMDEYLKAILHHNSTSILFISFVQ